MYIYKGFGHSCILFLFVIKKKILYLPTLPPPTPKKTKQNKQNQKKVEVSSARDLQNTNAYNMHMIEHILLRQSIT